MTAVWTWMECQRCAGTFLLPKGSQWCVHCERIISSDAPEVGPSTLEVAFAARRTHRTVERAVAELNRTATAMADVLCVDDEPWSTDEPMPDLRHLWDTRDAMLHGRPGKSYGGRYRAWTEVQ